MILKVLFVQQPENYEGQYAPEALVVMDEYSYEENPEWFHKECESALKKRSPIKASAVIDLEINQTAVREILNGPYTLHAIVRDPNSDK